jgi:bis(5'-nucleosidyl)-tetraphosphatase
MKKQTSAGIVVFHRQNNKTEYLLLQYAAGHWDFAKGKLEEGETKLQAARRELTEETGLTDIEIVPGFEETLSYIFKDFRGKPIEKTVTFFVGSIDAKKEIILSREHKGSVWLEYEQAVTRLTYSNAREVLIRAHEFLKKSPLS